MTLAVVVPLLYWMVGPAWGGSHYHRYPTVFPTLLYVAWLSAIVLPLLAPFMVHGSWFTVQGARFRVQVLLLLLVAGVMGTFIWKSSNFKAEKVMQYDFMARHQQWNRILSTIDQERPNNQIGVTVQNLALAKNGFLVNHLFDYNQNGVAGLLPDVGTDATSPLPVAEAFYQLGMIRVAQRTFFEAQEAIMDYQKSGRCYKRLAQTYLILGDYDVARKYLMALQKTLFYREWAGETLLLLGNEKAIDQHPEYGHLRKMNYHDDFLFSSHLTAEMLEKLLMGNTDNRLAFEYLLAFYVLTGDRENYVKLLQKFTGQ
jgi:tetratricopeptide (TPR) repeat protein